MKKKYFHTFFLKNKLKFCGKNVSIGNNVELISPKQISLGSGVSIGGNSTLTGPISIGTNSTLQGNNFIQIGQDELLLIGEGTVITLNCIMYGGNIRIGNNVMIAHDCSIVGVDHNIFPINIPATYCELNIGDIVIEDDVWIGCRSIILKNVRIGKRSIIGAGSVVTKDVEPYTLVAGNPARKIKDLIQKQIIMDIIDDSLFRSLNWHGAENWPPQIRWTKKKSLAYLKIDEKSNKLLIKAITSHPNILASIYINNKIASEFFFDNTDWEIIEIILSELDTNIIEVLIEVDKTWIPDEILNNGDKRELGIAVQKIWIE